MRLGALLRLQRDPNPRLSDCYEIDPSFDLQKDADLVQENESVARRVFARVFEPAPISIPILDSIADLDAHGGDIDGWKLKDTVRRVRG